MILKENKISQTSSDSETKTKPALLNKYEEDNKKEIEGYERLKTKESDKLPKPTGWRMIVLPFKMPEKTKGGLYLGQDTLERQQVASTCGLVLAQGPHCYDKEKFPEGPWCKKGDWVVFARYAGSRIQIYLLPLLTQKIYFININKHRRKLCPT
jgi:co-chaperonin GroES (HSP10)